MTNTPHAVCGAWSLLVDGRLDLHKCAYFDAGRCLCPLRPGGSLQYGANVPGTAGRYASNGAGVVLLVCACFWGNEASSTTSVGAIRDNASTTYVQSPEGRICRAIALLPENGSVSTNPRIGANGVSGYWA